MLAPQLQVFDAARLLSRANGRGVIVFMDEIDALGSQRSGNDDKMARRLTHACRPLGMRALGANREGRMS